jgi:uncharacterized membrane protein YgdD (TMEM256/DUF423 family)
MSNPAPGTEAFARCCVVAGAALMLAGVILGAFGTHLLQPRLTPREFSGFETAVLYQQLHALGLILVGLAGGLSGVSARLRWSARLMLIGIACFSGAIYLVTVGAPRWFAHLAPVGGASLMASWVMLGLHALSGARPSPR